MRALRAIGALGLGLALLGLAGCPAGPLDLQVWRLGTLDNLIGTASLNGAPFGKAVLRADTFLAGEKTVQAEIDAAGSFRFELPAEWRRAGTLLWLNAEADGKTLTALVSLSPSDAYAGTRWVPVTIDEHQTYASRYMHSRWLAAAEILASMPEDKRQDAMSTMLRLYREVAAASLDADPAWRVTLKTLTTSETPEDETAKAAPPGLAEASLQRADALRTLLRQLVFNGAKPPSPTLAGSISLNVGRSPALFEDATGGSASGGSGGPAPTPAPAASTVVGGIVIAPAGTVVDPSASPTIHVGP